MTILEAMAISRQARERRWRRRMLVNRMAGHVKHLLIILIIAWCYYTRAELAQIISSIFAG